MGINNHRRWVFALRFAAGTSLMCLWSLAGLAVHAAGAGIVEAEAQQQETEQDDLSLDREPEDTADALDRLQREEAELVPQLENGTFRLPELGVDTIATDQIGNGRLPDDFRDNEPSYARPLPESAADRVASWNWSIAAWEAANTFSYPLYFEDRMLERHGHERWGHLQPVASATRFVTSAVMLPYLTTLDQPCECNYTLGYYRSGNCSPKLIQRPPYERRAAIAEALWIGGILAIFP